MSTEEFKLDKTLYKGRPAERRIPKEEACYDLLDSLGIEYYRVDHDPADTVEKCHIIEDILGVKVTKNLFLRNRQCTNWYMLMMPGDKPFHTKDLSKQLGIARLSFGESDMMEKFLDITPGSVSILGLMNDKDRKVRLLIDRDILESEYIRCHPCINTSTLKIKTKDAMKVIFPYLRHVPTIVILPDSREQETKGEGGPDV